MNNLFSLQFAILLSASMVVSFIGFFLLIYVQRSSNRVFRKLFHISARKSTTNAVQLGGLPLSLAITITFAVLNSSSIFRGYLDPAESRILNYWIWAASGIIIYGYLDDKVELRPIVKLMMQIFSVFCFAFFSSRVLYPSFSSVAFVITFFWGMTAVNGCNLLDGLDTLTVKLTLSTFLIFAVFGIYFRHETLLITTAICAVPVVVFYLFNKEPATIHLGEIGGSYIGFTTLMLSSILFHVAYQEQRIARLSSLAIALIPMMLPTVELSISFLRRIYNKKSPFKGDKFHVHHILKNYHEFTPSNSASIMAAGYLITIAVALALSYFASPVAGIIVMFVMQYTAYIMVGKKYWKGKDTLQFNAYSLLSFLRKTDVMIIDTSTIEDFEISLVPKDSEGIEEELEQEYDEEEYDEDKAA